MSNTSHSDLNQGIVHQFQGFITHHAFPCVGAKSALARNQMQFLVSDNIQTATSDIAITKALQDFAASCTKESLFVSFAVIFENSPRMSEIEFEYYLWQRLQAMHELDFEDFAWDSEVSSDPDSPEFSMSIGGKSFYIIGLHPNASRPARKFKKPVMVFNLHSQFELLRSEGSYTRIRDTILERDQKIHGSTNPMLAQFGQSSEAMQYSGRNIKGFWKCPFHSKIKA